VSNSQKGGASAFLKAEHEKEQALGAPDDHESMLLSGRDPEEAKKRATINFEETSEKVIQFPIYNSYIYIYIIHAPPLYRRRRVKR
jgi:hypothetical protein